MANEVKALPECFDFAMDFLGNPEATEIRAYIEQQNAALAELRAEVERLNARVDDLLEQREESRQVRIRANERQLAYCTELRQRADTAEARLERAMRFMHEVRECLERENVRGGIADTLWFGPCETLFDAIAAFLEESNN